MGVALSTIGVKIGYAFESTAGTRPTAGYTSIHDLKSTPDFNVAPNTEDMTTFDDTASTRKVELLKDFGDTLEFNANLTNELITTWSTICSEADTAAEDDCVMWLEIIHPDLDKAFFLSCMPVELGLPAMEANTGASTSVFVVPQGGALWDSIIELDAA